MNLPAVTHNVSSLPVPKRPEYSVVVRRFNEWLGGRPVNEDTVREFLEAQTRDGYSARSVAVYKIALKFAVRAAFPTHDLRVQMTMDALFRSIKTPTPELSVQEKDLFSKSEISACISVADKYVGLFIQALYNTGSRVSELLSIRLDKCVEDRGEILARIIGKRKKERTLVIDKKLFDTIRKQLKGQVFLFESPYKKGTSGRCYTRQHMHRSMRDAARAACNRDMHPHSMRHSRITHLLAAGEPMDAVSRFAGHANVGITLKIYGHNTVSRATIRRTGLQ